MTPTTGSRRIFPATGGSPSSRRRHPARATISHSPAASWAPVSRRQLPCRPAPRARPRSPALRMWAPQGDPDFEGPRIPPGVGNDLACGARRHRRPDRRGAALDAAAALIGRRLEARGDPRGHLRGRPAISRDPPGICVAACPGSTPGSSGARRARERDRARRVQCIRRHAVRASAGAPDLATSAPPGYLAAEAISRLSRSWATSAPGRWRRSLRWLSRNRVLGFSAISSATSSRHR